MITPADQATMREVKDLIAFYEKRGKNWLLAAEFTLGLRSGELDRRRHWLDDYFLMPKRKARTAMTTTRAGA